jgi:hypothetical protein
MRTISTITLFVSLALLDAVPVLAQTGHDLFQQALVKERADGDLRGAIEIYERIAREFTPDRPLAAKALVQLGQCYEKLGSTKPSGRTGGWCESMRIRMISWRKRVRGWRRWIGLPAPPRP